MDYKKLDTLQLLTLKIAYTDILLQMHKNIRKIDNKLDELGKEKKKQWQTIRDTKLPYCTNPTE